MVQIKGYLRSKFKRPSLPAYPKIRMREPKLLIVLPAFKDTKKTDVRYPLLEPFAYAHIKWNEKKKTLEYRVEEPELAPDEKKMLDKIERNLKEMIDVKITVMERDKATGYLQEKVKQVMEETGMDVPVAKFIKIMYYLMRNLVGLNEIEPIMHDPYIEDLGCPGLNTPIYLVHRKYGSMETSVEFRDTDYLNNFVIKLSERCGRYISYAKPLLGGTLPDGSRIQATLAKDVTTKGPTFSIRKFRRNPYSPVDMLSLKTVSPELLAYLWFLVEYSISFLVCGGVASGKTTFLNTLSMFIPPEDKIVSIEDVREINIPHDNWIPATARTGFGVPEAGGRRYGEVTLFDLLKESFRMKPDYTIVGEVRGKEAYVMFQGMASGNPSMGTIHAGSVDDVIKRLQTPPIDLSPSLIEALDAIIVMSNAKEKGKSARRVKEIIEIQSIDSQTNKVLGTKTFMWIPSTDEFKDNTVESQLLHKISFERGISFPEIRKQLEKRKKVLEWMKRHNILQYDEVTKLVNLYYKDEDAIMDWVQRDIPPYQTKTKEAISRMWEESATGLKIIK
ncbi:MAG: type II/IV secretion system ATPase subunit [Candidatus Aenigmarchaeota archaeon]